MSTDTQTARLPMMVTRDALAPIYPKSLDDVVRMARLAAKAGLVPTQKDDTADTVEARAVASIMFGMEVGLPPMQAVRGVAVINGRAMIWGDTLVAVLWAKGFKVDKQWTGDDETLACTATIVRPDGTTISRTYTAKDAIKAGLWQAAPTVTKRNFKTGESYTKENDSPWFKYQRDMLGWKALARAQRDGASDATAGLILREDVVGAEPQLTEAAQPAPVALKAAPIDDLPDTDAPPPKSELDTGKARAAIAMASTPEAVQAVRNLFPNADWDVLEQAMLDRLDAVHSVAA